MERADFTITEVEDLSAILAEGPIWDTFNECYWAIDILGESLFKISPKAYLIGKWSIPGRPGAVFQKDKDHLYIAYENSLALFDINSGNLNTISTLFPENYDQRCNDGIALDDKRLLIGTSSEISGTGNAAIYYWEEGMTHSRMVLGDLGLSNGMVLSNDQKTLYHIDTHRYSLSSYTIKTKSGAVTDLSLIDSIELNHEWGFPDGMTLGPDRQYWIAFWHGGAVRVVSEKGNLLETFELPNFNITSIIFKGDFSQALVTSASDDPDSGDQGGRAFLLKKKLT